MKAKEAKKILKKRQEMITEKLMSNPGFSRFMKPAKEPCSKKKKKSGKKNLKNIVLLIDADNTQLTKLHGIMDKVAAHGHVAVKRAYGNWKENSLSCWEKKLKCLAIRAEHQFDCACGKNAADMALTIDAITLMNRGIYDAFVIVSSDSDYTPLAMSLHEAGMYVMGIGMKNAPECFRNACDEFLFLENMKIDKASEEAEKKKEEKKEEKKKEEKKKKKQEKKQKTEMDKLHKLLCEAYEKNKMADGYVHLGSVGNYLRENIPNFDIKKYGYKKLTDLINAFPEKYDVKRISRNNSGPIMKYRCI